jgi:hypothetical protein
MSITLDYEESTQHPWTLVAENNGKIVAAVCHEALDIAQLRLDCLLIELGFDVYAQTEVDGLICY